MSDMRGFTSMLANPSPGAFTRWERARSFTPWAPAADDDAGEDDAVAAIFDADSIRAEAFDAGFEEGRKAAERQLAAQRVESDRLIAALAKLQPEPPQALARVLAETVGRLVRQVVGEVEVDADLLLRRVEPLAALMLEQSGPTRLRLNPEDALLLSGHAFDVELTSDPTLARGSVVLETPEGWVEDGTDVGLDRLRLALDRMGAPR